MTVHTTARFSHFTPDGDRGGNGVILPSGNLHSYWDSRLGSSQTERFLLQLSATIQERHPKPARLALDPDVWAQEGFALRTQVYGFSGDGTERSPARMSDAYSVNAREISYERSALAAHRLAEFLNQRLR